MMLVSALAIDNAEISEEGQEAIRRWRSELQETSEEMAELTEAINKAINSHLDAKFLRRVKSRGRYETTRT
jgi:uncharacterized FlaG/YvyC family protein